MEAIHAKDNIFGRFFYSPLYVTLKNFLFNYRLRKTMITDCFFRLFPHVISNKNAKIIDIGSGVSPITPFPSRTLFIDLEEEAVRYLKEQGLNSITGDITNLSLPTGSVDMIFCSEVLEHIPDYKTALKELSRVLRKDGGIIITVPVHMNYWMQDDEFVGHFRRFDPRTLAKDIESAGLRLVAQEPVGNWLERKLSWLIKKRSWH